MLGLFHAGRIRLASFPALPLLFGFETSSILMLACDCKNFLLAYVNSGYVNTHSVSKLTFGIAGRFVLFLELAFQDLNLSLRKPRFRISFLPMMAPGDLVQVRH
jgi:hypothetical protein